MNKCYYNRVYVEKLVNANLININCGSWSSRADALVSFTVQTTRAHFQLRRTHIIHEHTYTLAETLIWRPRREEWRWRREKRKERNENERGCVDTELKVLYESLCINSNFFLTHKCDCIVHHNTHTHAREKKTQNAYKCGIWQSHKTFKPNESMVNRMVFSFDLTRN